MYFPQFGHIFLHNTNQNLHHTIDVTILKPHWSESRSILLNVTILRHIYMTVSWYLLRASILSHLMKIFEKMFYIHDQGIIYELFYNVWLKRTFIIKQKLHIGIAKWIHSKCASIWSHFMILTDGCVYNSPLITRTVYGA